jgi:hypothetical protein
MDTSIDPHKTHCYTHDQLIKAAFELELSSNLKSKSDNRELIENYLKDRIKEITDRWRN